MTTYKSFADALTATPSAPKAANDNRSARKRPEPRYRGTLPALRWLYDNHPDLAPAVADAVQALAVTVWDAEAIDNDQEIRPTVGELMREAIDPETGEARAQTVERDIDGNTLVRLGALRFRDGVLIEYGRTVRGRKLEPRDRIVSRDEETSHKRNPAPYMALRGAVSSPLHAEPYRRPFTGEAAIASMYDPQSGVEANRAILRSFGVDGSVEFERLPFRATKCPPAVAKGAEFLGGVVGLSGTSSSGAIMWEAPVKPKGEVLRIVEAIASGETLKEIGEREGYSGNYAVEVGKRAISDTARVLIAANDNKIRKNRHAA